MKKNEPKLLTFYNTFPELTKPDYTSGKALRMRVDWREQKQKTYKFYMDDRGKLQMVERYMPFSEKEIANMLMMEEKNIIGVIRRGGKIDKLQMKPIVFAELPPYINVERVLIREENKDEDEKIRVTRVIKGREILEIPPEVLKMAESLKVLDNMESYSEKDKRITKKLIRKKSKKDRYNLIRIKEFDESEFPQGSVEDIF